MFSLNWTFDSAHLLAHINANAMHGIINLSTSIYSVFYKGSDVRDESLQDDQCRDV